MSARRASLVSAPAVLALLLACGPPPPESCGEGEGENSLFGPTLDGDAAPADFGLLPRNGILHVAARNQGVPVSGSLRTDGIDASEHDVEVDEVGPIVRVLLDNLLANTRYVATLRINPGEAPQGAQTVRDLNFTTTDVIDNTPPEFQGDATVDAARAVDGVACSGPGALANILAPEIVEDTGVAGVMVIVPDDIDGDRIVAFHIGNGSLVHTREVGSADALELVAVDLAGNESAPLPVDVTVPSEAGCTTSAGSPLLWVLSLALVRRAGGRARPYCTARVGGSFAKAQLS